MTDYSSWGERELVEELERRDRAREALLNIFDYLNEQERSDYDSYDAEEESSLLGLGRLLIRYSPHIFSTSDQSAGPAPTFCRQVELACANPL